ITAAGPLPKVLVLTTFDLDEYAFGALRAGASGFLLKDVRPAALVAAIRPVATGDAVVSPRVTRRLLEEYAQVLPLAPGQRQQQYPKLAALNGRQRGGVIAGGRGVAQTPHRGGQGHVQPRDRGVPVRLRGHREVPRRAELVQARPARPGPGRGAGLRS